MIVQSFDVEYRLAADNGFADHLAVGRVGVVRAASGEHDSTVRGHHRAKELGEEEVAEAVRGEGQLVSLAVGSLRTALSRYPDDPDLRKLMDALIAGSPRFQNMWRASNFTMRRSMHKTIDHPDFGLLVLDCDTLLLPDTDQSMIVYSAAAGTREASALEMMRVTGTERMTAR